MFAYTVYLIFSTVVPPACFVFSRNVVQSTLGSSSVRELHMQPFAVHITLAARLP